MSGGILDLFNLYQDMNGLASLASDLINFTKTAVVMLYIGIIVYIVLTYVINGYMVMCVGRKAHQEDDWMAFIPVARQLYLLRIADCPWWYIFLFQNCFVNMVILLFLFWLFASVFGAVVLSLYVGVIYYIAGMVFTFIFYRRYYERFGFNRNMAWLEILWTFGIMKMVMLALVAFSKSVRFCAEGEKEFSPSQSGDYAGNSYDDDSHTVALGVGSTEPKTAAVTGVTGKYAGASFNISDGIPVTFGRSATEANIVFDQFEADISRKHCTLQYDTASGRFIVTDQSTNGTYLEDGSRLSLNRPVPLVGGTVIYLGKNKKNSFRLG